MTEDAAPALEAVLEAILLVTDEPVPATVLAQVAERPMAEVEAALAALAADYAAAGRGFELGQVGGGWRMYTRPDCAAYVERFVLDGQQARLTQAALETLAVIAYRQPVTRAGQRGRASTGRRDPDDVGTRAIVEQGRTRRARERSTAGRPSSWSGWGESSRHAGPGALLRSSRLDEPLTKDLIPTNAPGGHPPAEVRRRRIARARLRGNDRGRRVSVNDDRGWSGRGGPRGRRIRSTPCDKPPAGNVTWP